MQTPKRLATDLPDSHLSASNFETHFTKKGSIRILLRFIVFRCWNIGIDRDEDSELID